MQPAARRRRKNMMMELESASMLDVCMWVTICTYAISTCRKYYRRCTRPATVMARLAETLMKVLACRLRVTHRQAHFAWTLCVPHVPWCFQRGVCVDTP